jgi:hypothetical protein
MLPWVVGGEWGYLAVAKAGGGWEEQGRGHWRPSHSTWAVQVFPEVVDGATC